MSTAQDIESIRGQLAARTGTCARDWFVLFKARHGLQVAFKAIRDTMGDGSVVTQLLTCCTAVDPIIASGLHPRYAEISRRTAAIDPELLHLADDTRAVVLQHTYGIIDNEESEAIAHISRVAGAVLVEDCAHCVGRMACDKNGLPVADVSVHSFGIEKMLPTHFGGAVWVNPASPFASYTAELRARLESLPAAGAHLSALSRTYRVTNAVLARLPHRLSSPLRGQLGRMGLFEPAVSERERLGGVSHAPCRPPRCVTSAMSLALRTLDDNERMRVVAVGMLRDGLSECAGIECLDGVAHGQAQPLVRFPVLLCDARQADSLIEAVLGHGFYATAWYRPLLCPGVLDAQVYEMPDEGSVSPICADISSRVVALPCDLPSDRIENLIDVIRNFCA